MHKAVVLAVSGFLFVACASSRVGQANLPKPDVIVVQTEGVANAARSITGPIPVKYAVRIKNNATQPITLKRIDAQSIGDGAYRLNSTSRPFDTTVAADSYQDVEFWANAVVDNATITGANGPVTLRLILHFDSPAGRLQEVVVQQVNDKLTGEIP